ELLKHEVLFLEPILGPQPLGDVPENALDANGLPIWAVQRRLHHLDVESLSFGCDMLLDNVQDLPTLQDALVVPAILLGELARVEIKVRLTPDLLEAAPELRAELLVGESKAALEVLAEDHLGDGFDQRVIEDLGLAEGSLRPAVIRRGGPEGREETSGMV